MIVIHIGLKKAGSTTLQDFLSVNEEALRGIGVEYPSLARGRGRLSRTAHQNLQCQLRGRRRLFDPAAGTIGDMAEYWRQAEAETLILSCEGFEDCPSGEAERLKVIARNGEAFRIVLVVRDLVELMPSSYGQKIKFGMYHYDFDTFFQRRMREDRVDYFSVARNWAAAFGWKNLRIRLLKRECLFNGDLIDDFLTLAGVDLDAPAVRAMARPGDANLTPGWRVLEAMRALYGGWHGLVGDHPLADAVSHDTDQRLDCGFRAMEVGRRMGWNDERGLYLTQEQAQICLDVYAKAVDDINRHARDVLPLPASLSSRGFQRRGQLPHSSQIKAGRLLAFYDNVGRGLARQ